MRVNASLLLEGSRQTDVFKHNEFFVGDVGGYDGSECGPSSECVWPGRTDSPASRLLQGSAIWSGSALEAMPKHPQRQQRRAQVFAAREGHVWNLSEHVEAAALLTADGFTQ